MTSGTIVGCLYLDLELPGVSLAELLLGVIRQLHSPLDLLKPILASDLHVAEEHVQHKEEHEKHAWEKEREILMEDACSMCLPRTLAMADSGPVTGSCQSCNGSVSFQVKVLDSGLCWGGHQDLLCL